MPGLGKTQAAVLRWMVEHVQEQTLREVWEGSGLKRWQVLNGMPGLLRREYVMKVPGTFPARYRVSELTAERWHAEE